MRTHELVARFVQASENADPMKSAREVLESLRSDIDAIEAALAYISGIGGNARQVFYRSPDLTLLKVCFPSGRRTPPHDHGTWASILLLSGEEKNTLYRRENGALRRASEVALTRGSILSMRQDTVHVAECLGGAAAIGLHVYGGDILELPPHVESGDPRGATARMGPL
jgi:predicted metal-dependent enzyme (double-stranded beta helix superfamily)